jgi:hypothetical protein
LIACPPGISLDFDLNRLVRHRGCNHPVSSVGQLGPKEHTHLTTLRSSDIHGHYQRLRLFDPFRGHRVARENPLQQGLGPKLWVDLVGDKPLHSPPA